VKRWGSHPLLASDFSGRQKMLPALNDKIEEFVEDLQRGVEITTDGRRE
jgi:hypothetical protein